MSLTYSCPRCDSILNPDDSIMLIVATAGKQVLVGFHPQPGNYTVYTPAGFEFERGKRYEYYCPLCRQNLVVQQKEAISALHMKQGETVKTVLFSNISGKCDTRVVDELVS